MAEYQSIYHRIQVDAPTQGAVEIDSKEYSRYDLTTHSYWIGKLGDAQIGPVYLGVSGLISVVTGIIAIEIIGLNMWASVDWSVVEFVRQLFWLSLDPPSPEYGLSIPPLAEGGWWLMAGFFLTTSIFFWWIRIYTRARALGLGTHTAWAFAAAIWLYLVLVPGFHPTGDDG